MKNVTVIMQRKVIVEPSLEGDSTQNVRPVIVSNIAQNLREKNNGSYFRT